MKLHEAIRWAKLYNKLTNDEQWSLGIISSGTYQIPDIHPDTLKEILELLESGGSAAIADGARIRSDIKRHLDTVKKNSRF